MAAGNPEKKEIQFSDKEMDENQCNYRPFNCPYIECEDKLAADDVVSHVTSKHVDEFKKYDGPEITASMILTGPCFGGDGAWSPRMISCFGRTFFDVALTRDRSLHHWVWILGEEEVAQEFVYEITAFKGNIKYVIKVIYTPKKVQNIHVITLLIKEFSRKLQFDEIMHCLHKMLKSMFFFNINPC